MTAKLDDDDKYCVDCKHHRLRTHENQCESHDCVRIRYRSLVTGEEMSDERDCFTERMHSYRDGVPKNIDILDPCGGKEAIHWAKKR